jgi:RNA polymerase sigma-70 factor (ECF subfamily)
MDSQEQHTISLIRAGDKAVFRRLYDLYYIRLFLYAKSYLDDASDAEDIVQELFFELWKKREELEILTSLSSYLYRAVHNRSIQFLRHRKVVEGFENLHQLKMREAEILYSSASDFTFSEMQFKEIEQVFDNTNKTLPEKTREIFRLSRSEFKSNKEIAGLMNVEIKTVEYHISKALKIFYKALKEYFMLLFLFGCYIQIKIICTFFA